MTKQENCKREINKIIESLPLTQIDKDDIKSLVKPFPGNKWAAALAIGPYIDSSEEPLREATNAMLVFNEEIVNKNSAFARKINPTESTYNRMKYLYKMKNNNSSKALMFVLQNAELNIRKRKNINTNFKNENIYKENKTVYNNIINDGEFTHEIIKKLEALPYPAPGFWFT